MGCFICPNCKSELVKNGNVYSCVNNHCFDVSKYGYVNLLMSQQSNLKRHGDDKLMVKARRDFLSYGYYEKLKTTLCEVVQNNLKNNGVVADIGCGEGYYTEGISKLDCYEVFGIDISKDALKFASRLIKNGEFAVASAFNLPFRDKSIDCLLNVFAPAAYEEFYRVLEDDGVLIRAVPLCDHLWELKCAVYDNPYKNKPEIKNDKLFKLVSQKELKYEFTLDSSTKIDNLFKMTPYYYKTGKDEVQRLLELESLNVTAHFNVEVYKKII